MPGGPSTGVTVTKHIDEVCESVRLRQAHWRKRPAIWLAGLFLPIGGLRHSNPRRVKRVLEFLTGHDRRWRHPERDQLVGAVV